LFGRPGRFHASQPLRSISKHVCGQRQGQASARASERGRRRSERWERARARDAVVALLMSSADLLLMNPRTALTPFAHVYKTRCCVVRISRLAPRSRAGFLHDAVASTLAETNSSCLPDRGRWYRPRSVSPDSINPDLSTRRLGRD